MISMCTPRALWKNEISWTQDNSKSVQETVRKLLQKKQVYDKGYKFKWNYQASCSKNQSYDWLKKKQKKGHSYALNMELVWNQPMEILLPLLLGRNFNDMNPGQLGRIGLCKFTKQIHFTTEHYKETGFATYSTPHISQELHYWASTHTLNRKIV